MLRCAAPGGFLLIVHAADHGQAHAFKVEVNPRLTTSADIKQVGRSVGWLVGWVGELLIRSSRSR